jgi:hypothetical protein
MRTATLSSEELAVAAWPAAVGKRLASRTGSVRLFGRKLVSRSRRPHLAAPAHHPHPQILSKLFAILGPDHVEHLEFRIGAPRREPARATVADPRADGIEDPIFKLLYLNSRARSEREQERRERKTA